MVKATIEMENGTKIEVDGTAEELEKVLSALQGKEFSSGDEKKKKGGTKQKRKGGMQSSSGPSLSSMILALKEKGFFDTPRGLADIKTELEKDGYHYPVTTLSPRMLKLVRSRQVGRVKVGGKWAYVKR